MKRKLLITALVLGILISGLWIYKNWQWANMGYKQPQRESVESIEEIIDSHNLQGYHLVPKNVELYSFLYRYFNTGAIWVFNENKEIKISNLTSLDGNCYADIVQSLSDPKTSSSFEQRPNIKLLNKEPFLHLFDYLEVKTQALYEPKDIENYDQIVVMSWAKWMEISYRSDPQDVYKSISTQNMLLILLNLDYLDVWFPANEEVPTVNF